MYDQTAQVSKYRKAGGVRPRYGKRAQGGAEQIRLVQLLVCLVLFLTVFIGKGIFPTKLLQVRDNILAVLSSDTDFRAAFSSLGESLGAEEGSLLGKLGGFCVEVFGGEEIPQEEEPSVASVPQLTGLMTAESQFFSTSPDSQALSAHYFVSNAPMEGLQTARAQEMEVEMPPEVPEEPEAAAAVGTVLLKSDYDGQEPPEKYTMDQLSLGALETVAPVLGRLNSGYGYRDHPIDGQYQFHGGVDIGGQTGDPIRAFAAGTVEYIGEDNSYGLYLQIDHGNGVKSFYAHCSAIYVSKGQTVALGEEIAAVGSTGSATGPHLHLELKCNGIHVDPAYYLEFLTDQ